MHLWRTIEVFSRDEKNIMGTLKTSKKICVQRGAELNLEKKKGKVPSLDGIKELVKTH